MDIKYLRMRRQKLMDRIEGGLGVVFAAQESIRNHDVHYPFRQDSNFRYLTGLKEPDSILVLCTRDATGKKKRRTVLFVRSKDSKQEMWTGRRPGPIGARELSGVDEARPLEEFDRVFPELLRGHECLYWDFYNKRWRDRIFEHTAFSNRERKKSCRPYRMEYIIPLLGSLRLVKSEEEIAFMRKAAAISSKSHLAAMAMAAPDVSERALQGLMEYIMANEGAETWAYPGIVASGQNSLILHYIENKDVLKDGDLILIDVGAEYEGHAADITRTFPVNGRYSRPQKEMYQVVLEGQKQAIQKARIGNTLTDIHQAALFPIVEWMIEKKILSGKAEKLIEANPEKGGYRDYYVHSTGHWLGLDVHDNCPYQDQENEELKLTSGMVTTVEPGLYFSPHHSNVPKEFRGLGIRIEDDILITDKEPENLSSGVPKDIDEVEEACSQNYRDFV